MSPPDIFKSLVSQMNDQEAADKAAGVKRKTTRAPKKRKARGERHEDGDEKSYVRPAPTHAHGSQRPIGRGWGYRWNGDAVLDMVNEAAVEGLVECVEDLSARSQKGCPKVRGYNGGLVSTHYEQVDGETLSMRAGYNAGHAKVQHFARRYKHKRGEQALFLGQPLIENGRRYLDVIAEKIRQRLGRR